MIITGDDRAAFDELDARLRTMLPPAYQDSYESLEPRPMGSAGLKRSDDGRVAWDEIWESFCDLAMAGGPPHKGTLLEPAPVGEVEGDPGRYDDVVSEICRGVEMVSTMPCEPSPDPGWVRAECYSPTMAAWLLRAITMENVAARADGIMLDLPASPRFRLGKEIKNVITVIAKTCHYWLEHMPRLQQRAIADLFSELTLQSPLVEPVRGGADVDRTAEGMAQHIGQLTGLNAAGPASAGWLGLTCPDAKSAIWMMRALVVMNVLARRENQVLFVPVNPDSDSGGVRVWSAVSRVHRLAKARGVI
jgi:hypothetical protein